MPDHSHQTERAPILRVFGDHAGRMAILLRIRPSLLNTVAFAPRSAIHAIGAFLYLCPDQPANAELAELLEDSDPRDLLRSAIPNAPPRFYRALDRAGDHVRSRLFYERLAIACHSPLAEMILSGGILNDARLDFVETVLNMDAAVLSAPSVLSRSFLEIKAVDTLVQYLRAHDAFEDEDLHLPEGAGLKAILVRLQRAMDRLTVPASDFVLPPPFHIVRSVRELREIGSVLKNCVRNFRYEGTDHWFRLVCGSSVYVAADAPPMLASLMPVAPGLFVLDELRGSRNGCVDAAAMTLLEKALRDAGVRLVEQTPSRALSNLCCISQSSDNKMDDLDADDELDALLSGAMLSRDLR
jgi:hypothetical protein